MKNNLYITHACAAFALGYFIFQGVHAELLASEIRDTNALAYLEKAEASSKPSRAQFCPNNSTILFAKSVPPIWFDPNLPGGAHTSTFNGAEAIKALATYCGDVRLTTELLMQIRNILNPAKGPTATGGYQDQKQLGVAFMLLLARRTPGIWEELSARERALVDITMEAFMYSSVFTTKDEVATELGMNGDTNLNRDWNPNYQNGMVGMVILTALYWGFDQFEFKLANYDDEAFLEKLRTNKMTNLLSTYTNPSRPNGAKIQSGLQKTIEGAVYRFHGITERNLLGLFDYIAGRTFSATVSCGLNEGRGIGDAGRIKKNCRLLPRIGRKGMILEFDGSDAEGKRSSSSYSYDSWYPLNYVRAALQIDGWLTPSALRHSAKLAETLNLYSIGTNDLWFKISPNKGGGYVDFSHGGRGETVILGRGFLSSHGSQANLDLYNLLQKNLGLPTIE